MSDKTDELSAHISDYLRWLPSEWGLRNATAREALDALAAEVARKDAEIKHLNDVGIPSAHKAGRAVEESVAQRDRFWKRQLRSLEEARPLCPDHRDKQRGKPCLACAVAAERTAAQDAVKCEYGAWLKACENEHRAVMSDGRHHAVHLAVDKAVAAERERCARVATEEGNRWAAARERENAGPPYTAEQAAVNIAAAIREGGE